MQVTKKSVVLIIVAVMMMMVVQSECDPECLNWYKSLQICGSRLSDVLKVICKGKYYYPTAPDSHRTRNRRNKPSGIVEECCHSACSAFYLRTHYCADSGYFTWAQETRPCIMMPKNTEVVNTPNIIVPKSGPYQWGV